VNTYATYDYYVSNYGGGLDESEFKKAVVKASRYLEKITLDRCKAVTDEPTLELLNWACCEMTDVIAEYAATESGGKTVKSVSNQGYTETYVTEADGQASLLGTKLVEVAKVWLPFELTSYWDAGMWGGSLLP